MGQTYPLPITAAMLATANAANEGKPRYSTMADWAGGLKGDDVDQATATVSIANDSGGANEADYTPRTQAAKAAATGNTLAVDVARPRGWIAPGQPYGAVPAAPVVSSIAPTTAAAGSGPLQVTITGTGFSPYSRVITGGGAGSPWDAQAKYVSATSMTIVIDPRTAVPGTASVAVEDHDVLSNVDKLFTFT
jgi:hypothetical protein